MAKAYKCDRCQKFKLGYPALEVTDSYDTQQAVNPVYDELCKDCKADYLEWRSKSSEGDTGHMRSEGVGYPSIRD